MSTTSGGYCLTVERREPPHEDVPEQIHISSEVVRDLGSACAQFFTALRAAAERGVFARGGSVSAIVEVAPEGPGVTI
jgi:hypothetical protein